MKALLLIALFIVSSLSAQKYNIEIGKFGPAKIKYIENSYIEIGDTQIVFDTRMKYQPNRTYTVYNIESKEVDNTVTYYSLTFDQVGTDGFMAKMYVYKDKIIITVYDLTSKQSYATSYNVNK